MVLALLLLVLESVANEANEWEEKGGRGSKGLDSRVSTWVVDGSVVDLKSRVKKADREEKERRVDPW